MTYGEAKLKSLTYVDKPCLRMAVTGSKHEARDNVNKGYSYVDKKFVGSLCLISRIMECHREHTAMF